MVLKIQSAILSFHVNSFDWNSTVQIEKGDRGISLNVTFFSRALSLENNLDHKWFTHLHEFFHDSAEAKN